jgi:sRNA-binding protein
MATNTQGETMAHLHRDERDQYVKYLVDVFPKCFFEDPERRLPLKKNIVTDLERRCSVESATLVQMLGWYESHFAYQRKLLSGAERIDLDGKKAGTVTLQEQEEARRRITMRKKEMAERRAVISSSPAPTKPRTNDEYTTNGATMRKPETSNPQMAEMRDALAAVDDILTGDRYGALRPVLATAALKEIVAKAEKLIGELQGGPA